MTKTKVPNPGSDAALDQGCSCPVLDNGHGNEELGKIRGFWINADCTLHARKEIAMAKKAKKEGKKDKRTGY